MDGNPVNWKDFNGLCKDSLDCLVCLTYAEAGGTNSPCRKAIIWAIKNRKGNKSFPGQSDYCKVASEPGQYVAYNNNRYNGCCNGCLTGLKKQAMNNIIREVVQQEYASDPTNGATFFHDNSIPTPPWITKKIRQGKMSQVKVSGCSSFKFYKIN